METLTHLTENIPEFESNNQDSSKAETSEINVSNYIKKLEGIIQALEFTIGPDEIKEILIASSQVKEVLDFTDRVTKFAVSQGIDLSEFVDNYHAKKLN